MSGTFLSNQYGMPQHIGPMPDLVGPRAGTDLNRLIGNKAAAELCKKRVVVFLITSYSKMGPWVTHSIQGRLC